MTAQKSPGPGAGASQQFGGGASLTEILPDQAPARADPAPTAADHPPLSDQLINLLISTGPSYWDVWLAGYQSGLVQGAAERTLSQETMMDEIARRWEANRLLGEDVRAVMKTTISNIEVTANRQKSAQFTSSYKGGPVPWEPGTQGGGS